MLEDAADVPAGRLREVGVGAFAEEQGLTAFPEALVHVHAGAVVVEDRLGHEGGRLAVLLGHVAHDVLVRHHVVGGLDQLSKFHAEFVLTRACHLVVVLLGGNAQLTHQQEHLGADVLGGVVGSDREVALLLLNLVGEVAAFFDPSGVPARFDRVDAVEGAPFSRVVADVVEEEELRLRTEEGHVGQAGAGQMIQCPLGQGTGAALVGLAGAWLLNRADHAQGFVPVEGVHPGRVGVRHHGHVGGLDAFPAADG